MLSRFRTHRLNPVTGLFLLVILLGSVYLLTTPHYYLSPLPALVCLFVFAVGKKSLTAFYLLIFLIPFQEYTAFAEAYRFLTITKLLGILLFGVAAFAVLIHKRDLSRFSSNLWPALLIFFSVNLISTMLSDYPTTSIDFLRRLAIQYSFFALVLYFIGKRELSRGLPVVMIAGISISSALSVVGYFFDIPYFAMNIESETIKRAVGATNDPNYFSMMLVFSFPLLTHGYFLFRNKLARTLLGGLVLLNLTAVVLTFSRSGGLVLAIVLVLLGLEFGRRFRPIYLGFVGVFLLLALVGAAVLVPASYWERQKSVTNVEEERSLGRRMSYLDVAGPLFLANPILGSGPGTFRDHYEISRQAMEFSREGKTDRRAAHNAYLEVAVGTGLLGLIPFLLLIFVALRNFSRANHNFLAQNSFDMATLVRCYRICFIAFLLALLFLSAHFHKYFWLGLALSQLCLTGSLQPREETATDLRDDL